jgi:trans-2,3-dihydro-3-hydroxyanthranilate isomerase
MRMTGRNYAIYDVFTGTALAGNQLAVVFDCDGLETPRMQAIAREFNISETVFILPPGNPANEALARIFLPVRELPFAGHPTVGAAVALAEKRYGKGKHAFIVEEIVGDIACRTVIGEDAGRAEFDLPRLPQPVVLELARKEVAAALGVDPGVIGFDRHVISAWSAGVPYVSVPVKTIDAVRRAAVNADKWLNLILLPGDIPAAAYVYCRGGDFPGSHFHTRMFAPWDGIAEDPATGSAAAAFAGALMAFEELREGASAFRLEQGVEMGRPSFIDLTLTMTGGALSKVSIGGEAVRIAEGRLFA